MNNRLKKCGALLAKINLPRIFTYAFLIIFSYVFLYPFLYMLITSVKTQTDLFDISVNWIPTSLHFVNYSVAFNNLDYFRHLLNSGLIVVISTLGHILSCSFIAYGFARYKFPLKGLWFFLVVLAIIIPSQVIILPLYLTYSDLGWLNTYLPLSVPTFFGFGLRGGILIFLYRQYFIGLPNDLENAAKIDGCGFLGAYFRIAFPAARSSTVVCLVLSLVWHWNDYYEPVIYLGKAEQWPLPAMLQSVYDKFLTSGTEMSTNVNDIVTKAVLLAAVLLVFVPVLLLYAFLQKQFVQGIERSGLTGE